VAFLAGRVEDQDRRRPLRVVLRAESREVVMLVLDMHANGNKVIGDESDDRRIAIHLGIQPSAAGSHGGGGKVEQHVAMLGLCAWQGFLQVIVP
jgi:hypothetical protein